MSEIPELDIDQLDADLYNAWQAIQKQNYGKAETMIAIAWRQVRLFRLSLDDRHLPATTDRNLCALCTKFLYFLLNLWPLPCRKDYDCEWVYPYGFVPEGGCPWHD